MRHFILRQWENGLWVATEYLAQRFVVQSTPLSEPAEALRWIEVQIQLADSKNLDKEKYGRVAT